MFGSSSQHKHIMDNMFFEDEVPRARDERYQIEFGGSSRPSDEQQQHQPNQHEQQPNQCSKKRSYRRHTQEQIEELDAYGTHIFI
jgi:hypothetical protein